MSEPTIYRAEDGTWWEEYIEDSLRFRFRQLDEIRSTWCTREQIDEHHGPLTRMKLVPEDVPEVGSRVGNELTTKYPARVVGYEHVATIHQTDEDGRLIASYTVPVSELHPAPSTEDVPEVGSRVEVLSPDVVDWRDGLIRFRRAEAMHLGFSGGGIDGDICVPIEGDADRYDALKIVKAIRGILESLRPAPSTDTGDDDE